MVLSPLRIGVRLGEHDLSEPEDCIIVKSRRLCAPPVEDVGVEKTIPHPNFSNARKTNDVALVKLNRSVRFQSKLDQECPRIFFIP